MKGSTYYFCTAEEKAQIVADRKVRENGRIAGWELNKKSYV